MKIRVLGCHGSDMLLSADSGATHCCGFLVNETVLIDAGTIASSLTLQEQLNIRHICLSHLHFDHIKALPTFADNVSLEMRVPVHVTSIQSVMDGLRRHIFNDTVYPNFFSLPDPGRPVFGCNTVTTRQPFEASGLEITAIPVNHSVPTVGFLIREGGSSFLYSGDTCSTEELWKIAAQDRTLKAAFIETSFPDELSELALTSKHLTPALLSEELRKLDRPDVPLYIYHMKPGHKRAIEAQLHELQQPGLTILREGQEVIL
jgi:ribonuclease BN (tRNA processing enzyme)